MGDRERETAFLGQVLSYDDTAEGQRLKARITQAHQKERCVRQALRLPVLLLLLAAVGLGYWEAFVESGSSNMTWPARQSIANGFYGAGLGSLASLLALWGLATVYRKRTVEQQEECRRFAAKLLQTRLGKPTPPPLPGVVQGQQVS